MAPPIIQPFIDLSFGAEAIYTFIIILCSILIYRETKELYELSSYKGLKYFRQAFLFFSLAYFFRFFIKFVLIYFNVVEIFEIRELNIFAPITLFIFVYFSSLAIFYLLYSVMWKKWGESSLRIYLFHIIALAIALISILTHERVIYLAINLLLLAFVITIVLISSKDYKNKKHNMHNIYLLLLMFWILNVIDILIPKFLQMFQLLIYLASSGIFLMILYRVLKKTGN